MGGRRSGAGADGNPGKPKIDEALSRLAASSVMSRRGGNLRALSHENPDNNQVFIAVTKATKVKRPSKPLILISSQALFAPV
jgi:hypothetical protein